MIIRQSVTKYLALIVGMVLWGTGIAAIFLDWPEGDLGSRIDKRRVWNSTEVWSANVIVMIGADGLAV
jgi:hypothetical protein